jgi:hypothetical protein
MYVLRTLHAPSAVVCVVSSMRSPLISLQTFNHSFWTPSAAVWREPKVWTHALTVACAVEWAESSPSQPCAAAAALLAALQPFEPATTRTAAASAAPNLTLRFSIESSLRTNRT